MKWERSVKDRERRQRPMVKWEAGRRVEAAKEGEIVSRAARGIPIDNQTLSQICSQSDTPVHDSYASCAIPWVPRTYVAYIRI
jgi:hypothetical protein